MRILINKTSGGHTLIVEKGGKPVIHIALDGDKIATYGVTNPNEITYCAGPLYIGEDEAKVVQAVALKLEVSQVIAEKMVADFKADLLKATWAADLVQTKI